MGSHFKILLVTIMLLKFNYVPVNSFNFGLTETVSISTTSPIAHHKSRSSGYDGAPYAIHCDYCNIWMQPTVVDGQGQSEFATSAEVLNGRLAQAGEFPYVVYVRMGHAFCGGSIYDNVHIVTAAHCLFDKDKRVVMEPSTIRILAGTVDRTNKDKSGQSIQASEICTHRAYPDKEGMDIGIIKLSRPLTFNNFVRPAKFLWAKTEKYGANGTVSAWGRALNPYGNATIPGGTRYMQTAGVKVYHPVEVCDYTEGHPRNVMCAGTRLEDIPDPPAKPSATCNGDSGSPLGCWYEGSKYEACGFVSYAVGSCDKVNKLGKMSIFTKLATKKYWIEGFTQDDSRELCY